MMIRLRTLLRIPYYCRCCNGTTYFKTYKRLKHNDHPPEWPTVICLDCFERCNCYGCVAEYKEPTLGQVIGALKDAGRLPGVIQEFEQNVSD